MASHQSKTKLSFVPLHLPIFLMVLFLLSTSLNAHSYARVIEVGESNDENPCVVYLGTCENRSDCKRPCKEQGYGSINVECLPYPSEGGSHCCCLNDET
ncbi:hypothetical protein TorRG33x02_157530 [Trema orientale]|uniref:Defensin-like protein n=1 Tax=Trema orientale TaxID=63057 RepID=A0A2P5ES52_TREOI|nr:hypothetical protein TorRG33x02_157530 [Trema orientale]